MERILSRCVGLLVLLALAPLGAWAQTITGTATWRERIALPHQATFEAVLQDVSRADARAPILGRVRIAGPLQPPLAFEIAYDPAQIRPEARYGVSARIRLGDRLLFVTDRLTTVLTQGAGAQAELVLRGVGGTRAGEAPAPAPLRTAPPPHPPFAQRGAELLGALPASYAGALPCADCEAIDWRLDLLANGAYRLARRHRGKPEASGTDVIGRWRIDVAQRVLHLRDGAGAETLFDIGERGALRLRDRAGQPIDSRLNYQLERRAAFEPLEPLLTVDGLYSAIADSAAIVLCATGERLPVVAEADNVALERGYGALQARPGEWMLVTLEARIAQLPGMDGGAPAAAVVPMRFVGAWPRETCAVPEATTALQETYWRLTRLRESPVEVTPRAREPHLVLRDGGRLTGSGGCNRLVGGYVLTREQIDVAGIGLTRMACPSGMEQEARFTAALGEAVRWRIDGRHLDLFDVAGARILRFEAVSLR